MAARDLLLPASQLMQEHKGLEPDAVTLGGHARWDIERVKGWVRDQLASGEATAQGQHRAGSDTEDAAHDSAEG